MLQAVYLFQNGEPDRARKLLAEAQKEDPQHPVPPLFLGQLDRPTDPVAARRFFDIAAKLPLPKNWPRSHRQRFLVMLHSARFQLAQDIQDEALARDALADWIKCEPENKQLRDVLQQFQPTNEPSAKP